jgi:hypothetical protein
MTDDETTMLYALSTLAQTCAALAAFVGAVGIYRLQGLVVEHARNEHTLRGLLAGTVLSGSEVQNRPIAEVVSVARANTGERSGLSSHVAMSLRGALAEWDAHPARRHRATRALIAFETWNLLVIFGALVGFNHVALLASSPWTLRALWPAALITVAVTVYCVFVWTRDTDARPWPALLRIGRLLRGRLRAEPPRQ